MAELAFLIPLCALVLLTVTHVALLRLAPAMHAYMAYKLAFAAGLLATFAADAAVGVAAGTWIAWLDRALPDTLAYAGLGYSYFHFFNLSETGRRMRLMIELLLSPGGLTEQELLQRYPPARAFEIRIARLAQAGQVVSKDGRIYDGGKRSLALAADVIFLLRRVLFG